MSRLQWHFPIKTCSGIPVGNHSGAFGTQRKYENHTGIDLYTNNLEPVFAVEDGIVVGSGPFTGKLTNSTWWNDTDYLLVEGITGVVCYGEISIAKNVGVGTIISACNHIGYVVRVLKDGKERPDIVGHSTSMLHLELYPHGTRNPSNGFEPMLRDATRYLLDAIGKPEKELI